MCSVLLFTAEGDERSVANTGAAHTSLPEGTVWLLIILPLRGPDCFLKARTFYPHKLLLAASNGTCKLFTSLKMSCVYMSSFRKKKKKISLIVIVMSTRQHLHATFTCCVMILPSRLFANVLFMGIFQSLWDPVQRQ